MSALTFSVEVDYTDRAIVDGRFRVMTVDVEVLAETDVEASLVAAQMVIGMISADSMVVATRIVGVVA